MKTYQLFLLSILSALLLTFAWLPNGFTPLIFIALVPILMVEDAVFKSPQKYKTIVLFACTYLCFFTWNILTTWWIKNASFAGAAMAIISNALLMTIVFLFYHKIKKRLSGYWSQLIFISFWITFEFLHLDWDLTWTWLTLGNVFAENHNWVQWYEYTGVFGGSLWVLIANCIVFNLVSGYKAQNIKKQILALCLLIIFPLIISYAIITSASTLNKKVNVLIVQPNIDPYNEKFVSGAEQQLEKMLQLTDNKIDTTIDYLIFPETAITENLWESELEQATSIKLLRKFLTNYPKVKIVIGASTAKLYQLNEKLSSTARKFKDGEGYYDTFNSAIQIDTSKIIQVYHKSKLVPGVEKMPFPFIFKYFEKFAINLGGASGSLGEQKERSVFFSPNNSIKLAPVVCYESVYGEYVSEYIKNGAQFITIITNDGWWGDTPGYKQHLKYGVLRAIETRRYIARSANTGISCIITDRGEIEHGTKWWTPEIIKAEIKLNTLFTFYTRYGDYIGRAAMYLTFILTVYSWLLLLKLKRKKNSEQH